MFKKIDEGQEMQMNGEESKDEPKDVKNLVDKNMLDLLRACSMLSRPSKEDIELRRVKFGEKIR